MILTEIGMIMGSSPVNLLVLLGNGQPSVHMKLVFTGHCKKRIDWMMSKRVVSNKIILRSPFTGRSSSSITKDDLLC